MGRFDDAVGGGAGLEKCDGAFEFEARGNKQSSRFPLQEKPEGGHGQKTPTRRQRAMQSNCPASEESYT
ncbi:hypothetical protein CBS101457_000074 [Exobasidium rhododendri]|nr:hypothetical protein CBS101457_000074 [Exobasidium rhododendri]